MPTCKSLLKAHHALYTAATHHPFLEDCKAGTITEHQFHTWLAQDYVFVQGFVGFAGSVLAAACAAGVSVDGLCTLARGIGTLGDELQWFQDMAGKRSLQLHYDPLPACRAYIEMMRECSESIVSFAVQMTVFWAIERVYNEAWRVHKPMAPAYEPFAERWGNDGFSEYVGQLEKLADVAMAVATEEECSQAHALFLKVCELEVDFWDMAYSQD